MISSIHLLNFRSHSRLSLTFSHKTNVIIGRNGSGKTNILEAILMLGAGKSFRAPDISVIQHEQPYAHIKTRFLGDSRSLMVKRTPEGKVDKSFELQGKNLTRLSFHKTIPLVLFEPNFMHIITRGPDSRRTYFDSVLSRTEPSYQTLLNKYRRVLAQRNNLLKHLTASSEQLFVWDISLSELAGEITKHRLQYLSTLNRKLGKIYSQIADSECAVKVEYVSDNNLKNYSGSLLRGLEKSVTSDIQRGFTSLGPHRDDFSFLINSQPASLSASRGENRTLLLALKIIEAELIQKARTQPPILLLDDVFSELDEVRQTKLVEYFNDNQVIITTTNITPLMKGVSGQIFEL